MQIWRSSYMKGPPKATVGAVAQNFHGHLDRLGIQDGFDAFTEETVLFSIVAELIEVFQLDTFHEVIACSIIRE